MTTIEQQGTIRMPVVGSLSELTKYRSVNHKVTSVLNVLWRQPDQSIHSSSGRATDTLMQKLPITAVADRKGDKVMSSSSFTMTVIQRMEKAGWISRELNGKRTMAISLVAVPADWTPPKPDPVRKEKIAEATPATPNGIDPNLEEVAEAVNNETLIDSFPGGDDDAELLGGRPGRLAARIERTIPALVEESVVTALNGWIGAIATSMGYKKGGEAEEVEQLITRLGAAADMIAMLEEELVAERNIGEVTREMLNTQLRKDYSTRDTTTLRPTELPEAWRSLAGHALRNGWLLRRTPGGHIMWKSPTGVRYFSSSTTSDRRAVRNARSDMEKMGLPKE